MPIRSPRAGACFSRDIARCPLLPPPFRAKGSTVNGQPSRVKRQPIAPEPRPRPRLSRITPVPRPADYPPPFAASEFIAEPAAAEDERIDVGVLVVGAGPAGLAAAIRLGQLLGDDPET